MPVDFEGNLEPGLYTLEVQVAYAASGFPHHSGVNFGGGANTFYEVRLDLTTPTEVPGLALPGLVLLVSLVGGVGVVGARARLG